MKGMIRRFVSLVTVSSVLGLILTGCTGSGGDGIQAPTVSDIEKKDSKPSADSGGASANDTGDSGSAVSITSAAVPSAQWQKELSFPYQAGYTDDTLAMNSTASFLGFMGQGKLYVTVPDELKSFDMYINHEKIDTTSMTSAGSYEIDFPGASVNGTNLLLVSDIRPFNKNVKVFIPYPEVITQEGSVTGVDEESFRLIEDIITSDIEHGFSSAQLAVIKDGKLIYDNAWGLLNSYDQEGNRLTEGTPVTTDTMYDLASNTKMYSAAYAVQYLVTQGMLTMDTRISDIIGSQFYNDTILIEYAGTDVPELQVNKDWKRNLTIRDVMMHQAGFPASPGYHMEKYDQVNGTWKTDEENVLFSGYDGSEETRKNTLSSICKTPLMYKPGSKTLYSDVDYMLLCFCVEKLTGKNMQSFLKETFWDPMGLKRICYEPLENGFSAEDCAATELNGNTRDGAIEYTGVRKNTIQGECHDEAAYYAMGGISGHAGMFANASDLAKLASVMLTGGYGEHRFFSRDVLDAFTAPQSDLSAKWGVGWYREGDGGRAWYFGEGSSADTIGHQGWTGTLTMIDPDKHVVVVYLTNKRNTPVTDKDFDPNQFDGNWYTSSTLGFVPQVIFQGMDTEGRNNESELYSLLTDMVKGKFKLIDETAAKAEEGKASPRTIDKDHPIVQAAYSLMEVYVKWSVDRGYKLTDESVSEVMGLMDSERDAEEISFLQEKYG